MDDWCDHLDAEDQQHKKERKRKRRESAKMVNLAQGDDDDEMMDSPPNNKSDRSSSSKSAESHEEGRSGKKFRNLSFTQAISTSSDNPKLFNSSWTKRDKYAMAEKSGDIENMLLHKLSKQHGDQRSWREIKKSNKEHKEQKLLNQLISNGHKKSNNYDHDIGQEIEGNHEELMTELSSLSPKTRPHIAIALPGSILENAQTLELRSYLAGQIARAAATFCIDEIVIFDESARLTKKKIDDFTNGEWSGREHGADSSAKHHGHYECNLQMARILQFLECPQYLRKQLYPMDKMLKHAGILNPLDLPHHFRFHDVSVPYREGIVLDKPVKAGRGSLCDIGLDKEFELDRNLEPGTRVTVRWDRDELASKRPRGTLVHPREPFEELGLYWGYNVRIASCLSEAISAVPAYDYVVGTSERGRPIEDMEWTGELNNSETRILILFGGLGGLETAVENDETIAETDPAEFCNFYLNALPGQGCRTIRTEEAIPIALSQLIPMILNDH